MEYSIVQWFIHLYPTPFQTHSIALPKTVHPHEENKMSGVKKREMVQPDQVNEGLSDNL